MQPTQPKKRPASQGSEDEPSIQPGNPKRTALDNESTTAFQYPMSSTNLQHPVPDMTTQSLDSTRISPDDLKVRIEQAVNGALARYAGGYTTAKCLLITWEADDLGCIEEVNELFILLRILYGFQCELFSIPSTGSQKAMRDKLTEIETGLTDSELLILYYGGHSAQPQPGANFHWYANTIQNSPSLDWTSLQSAIVEDWSSGVVFIFDCCFAAYNTAALFKPLKGKKEVLAAVGWDRTAVGGVSNKSSFTAFLIRELEKCDDNRRPFTISELYTRILQSKRAGNNPSENPHYCNLACEYPQRQIVLFPRSAKANVLDKKTSLTSPSQPEISEYPRMIITVSITQGLENTSAERFTRWLTEGIPTDVQSASVTV